MARHRPPEHDDAGFRVLFYHRVSDDRDLLAVRPRAFRRQMELLAARGCRRRPRGRPGMRSPAARCAPRTVVLNFDDGYRDVAEHAVPVLRDLGFTATVFIAPGLTDGTSPMPWYRVAPPLLELGRDADAAGRWAGLRAALDDASQPAHAGRRRRPGGDRGIARDVARASWAARRAFCYRPAWPASVSASWPRRRDRHLGQLRAGSGRRGKRTAMAAAYRDRPVRPPRGRRAKVDGAHDRSLPGRALYRGRPLWPRRTSRGGGVNAVQIETITSDEGLGGASAGVGRASCSPMPRPEPVPAARLDQRVVVGGGPARLACWGSTWRDGTDASSAPCRSPNGVRAACV